ncbi:hypothetical protein I7I53_10541 [Histoplasma capsulatum var. duboisii H88]|uniref:Uncharacterized protein n=1 Tax=Ajellomyces capsulatus (strain H88) TaxID=544711 RepID=A0A8A1L8P5_AJEC8|nr:hypothetical protein I7I53_10541 [Histoplasma capsulatum var. duboisii H88]
MCVLASLAFKFFSAARTDNMAVALEFMGEQFSLIFEVQVATGTVFMVNELDFVFSKFLLSSEGTVAIVKGADDSRTDFFEVHVGGSCR